MQTSYAAGKKLLDHLALSLSAEYPDLDFQSIKPYYVATKMTQNKLRHNYNFTTMIPSAEEYTRQALGTIGKRISTHGYAPHCIQSWMRNFSEFTGKLRHVSRAGKCTSVKLASHEISVPWNMK